ncbi:MAG: FtsH protease activity modulator HflK, partial [Deferribacteraceae bacterium]|nr:FtsH protease activity modulator HflK [Deferribacteraceae bacterium]
MSGYADNDSKDFPFKEPLKRIASFTTKTTIVLVIMVGLALVGYTCFYIVSPSEQGVIKRFGEVTRVAEAGPHFKLPFPIETVSKAKVTEIHRMEIGYRGAGASALNVPNESHMLTGDENIISIDLIVQYQIKDVVQYLFSLQDVESTIRLATEASIREIAGKVNIDDLLTTGKESVQDETRMLLQEILNNYSAGVQVLAVELQDIAPPAEVMGAFQDVASAREDKNKFINEAQAYENQKIPMARAQAATVVMEAESYKAITLGKAEGEASRFQQVYESYRKAPDV